jgi:putative ABC transport system substrate-binding protein
MDGLREHGWEEGRNVLIEARSAGSDPARFPDLAAELVALKVDVIVADTTPAIEAARRKTTTIPIVMVAPSDPVGSGFIASFARPGGNITGLANHFETASGKHFELLKAVKPGLERVGVMYNPDNAASVTVLKHQQEQVAPRLDLVVVPIPVSRPADFDEAFALIARERLHALHVHPAPPLLNYREKIAAFAIKQRLPTATGLAVMARDGFMMSYGNDLAASFRRSAAYVDQILKGANPAELPIEQVERQQLVVNLKTARELGLAIPASILLRADDVIE